ncbi:non-ribosomal peptide synthetase module [Paenibacillus turpanensis]|uniref:non-ribosomal peptide synthetase module n=1 Tax=Paenibacillus turpanensis TaxID=2689078 RepID=UPI00140BCFB8|nr:non-ribosomal peptide synthetase module [Paenibacillus turpanensis]
MAQRLATEYVQTCLTLTEAEMQRFIQLFSENEVSLQEKVLENGNQEVVLEDEAGKPVVLSFQKKLGKYVAEGSCRLNSPKLANAMRKAVSAFKGSAIVNRIYPNYVMVYQYKNGSVIKITELSGGKSKVVYEYKDTVGQLQRLFDSRKTEAEIKVAQLEIDELLDLRLRSNEEEITAIDEKLKQLVHKLFVFEA